MSKQNFFEHKIERSSSSHAILESSSRKRKAAKIISLLNEVVEVSSSIVLDIGTGSGDIASEIGLSAKKVYSIDIVDERKIKSGYSFKTTTDEAIPFRDGFFDVIVSNHVIEHTPNQDKHVSEMLRVLKPGGYIYIATPNKYWITDPHYKLPFISWMPRKLSALYLKKIQGKEWDIYPVSVRKIKWFFSDSCEKIINALPYLVKGKSSEVLDTWDFTVKIGKYVPNTFLGLSQYISPTMIYLIQKRRE